jgi:hypothetical protein
MRATRPMPLFLLLLLGALRSAQAPQVTLKAAAAGFSAKLDCGTGGIAVTSATYEPTDPAIACEPINGKPLSDKDCRPVVATACDGKSSCDFPVCPYAEFPGGGPGNDGAACQAKTAPIVGDPCPNHVKAFVVEYDCTTDMGWTLVAVLLVGGGLYVGAGVAHGSKASGKPLALDSHPHHRQWQELRALAMDGAAYARARAQGRAGGYEPVRVEAASAAAGGGGGGRNVEGAKAGGSGGGGGGGKAKRDKQASEKRSSKSVKGKGSRTQPADAPAARTHRQQQDATEAPPRVSESEEGGAAAGTGSSSSAAGGGGRWVHLPG